MIQNVLEAQCLLQGNVIQSYEGVTTEDECYLLKLDHDDGTYFLFNKENGQCMIYDSSERSCTANHGPVGVSNCIV